MALDALFLTRLTIELNERISGARIDKIHQPERDEIVMNLRAISDNMRLLISAGSSYPRVHLTEQLRENPQVPPMFCMLMRKHFAGGRIMSVSQPDLERAIDITVEVSDEMGIMTRKIITIELLGRYSNIILRDGNDRIIDCLKRIDLEMSEQRRVLPGLYYMLPPRQEKVDVRELSYSEVLDLLLKAEDVFADKWIMSNFLGFAPLTAREALYRATGETDAHISNLTMTDKAQLAKTIQEVANECKPTILYQNGNPVDFSYCNVIQYDGHYTKENIESPSALLESFYAKRDFNARMASRTASILKIVKNALARAERKISAQKNEINEARGREKFRRWGDIITANIYSINRGDKTLVAQDFYSENYEEIEIPLDTRLSPQQNAARYYKNYNRLKNAAIVLKEQISAGEAEIIYLDSVLEALNHVENERDIAEIREELAQGGYLRAQGASKRAHALAPREFISSDGFKIYAGRNNRQNDLLTLKSALRGDVWMHTQKIPGSHVIVECAGHNVPDSTLTEAACIAAYYSRARESQNVPVDYTEVRNVKKPNGARPGMVIYNNYQTAYVSPDAELIEKLKIRK